MSCPFYYAQIVSVFPAAVSPVITFMSPLKRLLFRLNNLIHPICPARSEFLDLVFSFSPNKRHFLLRFVLFFGIRNLTQEEVLQLGSVALFGAELLPWLTGSSSA